MRLQAFVGGGLLLGWGGVNWLLQQASIGSSGAMCSSIAGSSSRMHARHACAALPSESVRARMRLSRLPTADAGSSSGESLDAEDAAASAAEKAAEAERLRAADELRAFDDLLASSERRQQQRQRP